MSISFSLVMVAISGFHALRCFSLCTLQSSIFCRIKPGKERLQPSLNIDTQRLNSEVPPQSIWRSRGSRRSRSQSPRKLRDITVRKRNSPGTIDIHQLVVVRKARP